MSRVASETRSLRSGLNAHLATVGWPSLNFSEGWDSLDIETPLVNVYVIDGGKENLELGKSNQHLLFRRMVQIDVFMESEDRTRSLCEDVMEYLDYTSFQINDILTTSGIGYLSFPDTESITSIFFPPVVNNPEILRWRGSVRGRFEAYYPNGGNPI